jgi:hypothetical protein
MHVAINSVRGDGLAAAVRYAVWVESNLRGEAEQPVGLEALIAGLVYDTS